MGKLEKRSKLSNRRNNLRKAILKSVAAAGFLSMALLAPNALQVLQQFGVLKKNEKFCRGNELIKRSRDRLIKSGYLRKEENGFVTLTEKGKLEIRKLELNDYKIKKPLIWDSKWRMLIFDIPEYRRETRDKVRKTLVSVGFVRLQNSVWVYPYDCEDLITLLKADFKIGKDLLYVISDQIENDFMLRRKFGL